MSSWCPTYFYRLLISLILIDSSRSIVCPPSYNLILNGCYKLNNGTKISWSGARNYCANDSKKISNNQTNFTTHLVALESAVETTSLIYWLKAWSIQGQFWTDGVVPTWSWSWSNQSLIWYLNASQRLYIGNGSHFRLIYSSALATYEVVDDTDNTLSNFICEYQEQCSSNNSCLNGATCYLNVGRELCICAPGYTGTQCDEEIDECLTSPCQHGGVCSDLVNNYTCDCSAIFFTGPNCDISKDDPGESQRSAAFWSVLGIVCALVALLTISDLPWEDIAQNIGCAWFSCRCCSKANSDDDFVDTPDFQGPATSTPFDNENFVTVSQEQNKGVNYQVMNTVWNPERMHRELSSKPMYPDHRSPDHSITPDNILIRSFAAAVIEKQRQKRMQQTTPAIPENPQERSETPVDNMTNWTQKLQEQLKSNPNRENSASSTKKLISTMKNIDEQ